MSQQEAYKRMIASLTRSVMLLMSIAVVVFVFTSASDVFSGDKSDTIATINVPTDGAILGSIISETESFKITLLNEDTSVSKSLNTNGDYFFKGIEPGNYKVTIQSLTNQLKVKTIENVTIATGEVTALGVHEL